MIVWLQKVLREVRRINTILMVLVLCASSYIFIDIFNGYKLESRHHFLTDRFPWEISKHVNTRALRVIIVLFTSYNVD